MERTLGLGDSWPIPLSQPDLQYKMLLRGLDKRKLTYKPPRVFRKQAGYKINESKILFAATMVLLHIRLSVAVTVGKFSKHESATSFGRVDMVVDSHTYNPPPHTHTVILL